jgi:hypothetical protein
MASSRCVSDLHTLLLLHHVGCFMRREVQVRRFAEPNSISDRKRACTEQSRRAFGVTADLRTNVSDVMGPECALNPIEMWNRCVSRSKA